MKYYYRIRKYAIRLLHFTRGYNSKMVLSDILRHRKVLKTSKEIMERHKELFIKLAKED